MTETTAPANEPDDFEMAAQALTRAIRAMNADQRPGDGGEFLTRLLATVAANLGSSAAVTASRPGSWEATSVQQVLASTVGEDDRYLLTYRTEPIELIVDTVDSLDELGIYQTYEASLNHIGQAMFGTRWTPARSRLTLNELGQIEDVIELLADLERRDRAEYQVRFTTTVRAEFEQLRADEPDRYPAHLAVTVRYADHTTHATPHRTDPWDTPLVERLYEFGRKYTTLPGSDTRPRWEAYDRFAGELLAAGHWPHLRIPELAHYDVPTTPKEN
jgi:hypothetical protein